MTNSSSDDPYRSKSEMKRVECLKEASDNSGRAVRDWWFYESDEYHSDVLPENSGASCFIEKSTYDNLNNAYECLKKEFDMLCKERDDYIDRYRRIELANTEITRNDHVHFGKLMEELAACRKAMDAQADLALKLVEERNEARAEIEAHKKRHGHLADIYKQACAEIERQKVEILLLRGKGVESIRFKESVNEIVVRDSLLEKCEVALETCADEKGLNGFVGTKMEAAKEALAEIRKFWKSKK